MITKTREDISDAMSMGAGRASLCIGWSWRNDWGGNFFLVKPSTTRTESGATTETPTLNSGLHGSLTGVEYPILLRSLMLSLVATAEKFIGRQLLAAGRDQEAVV
jgi:hypothetical protein